MNNQESKKTKKQYEKKFLRSLQVGFLRKHRYVLFASIVSFKSLALKWFLIYKMYKKYVNRKTAKFI